MKYVIGAGVAMIVASFIWFLGTQEATQAARVAMLCGELSYVEYQQVSYQSTRPLTLQVAGIFVFFLGLFLHSRKGD